MTKGGYKIVYNQRGQTWTVTKYGRSAAEALLEFWRYHSGAPSVQEVRAVYAAGDSAPALNPDGSVFFVLGLS